MTPPRPDALSARRNRLEWLALATVAALLVLCAVVFQMQARSHVLRQQSEQLQVQARVVSENVLLQVNGIDRALTSVSDDFFSVQPGEQGLQAAQHRFRELAAALPGVRAILVLDAKGNVLAATRDELVGKKFSGRDYFVLPRNKPLRGVLYVSRPFETAEGEWVMPLSRPLLDKQGAFAGVVVAGLDSKYLAVVLRSVLYSTDMAATLAHGDGNLFLQVSSAAPGSRRPNRGDSLVASGRPTQPTDDPEIFRVGKSSTSVLVVSKTIEEDSPRLAPAMVVELMRTTDAILGPWRHDGWVTAAMLVMSLLLSVIGMRTMQVRRAEIAALAAHAQTLQEQSTRRIRMVTDNLPALVAYIDRDHRYRFANARYRTFYNLDPEGLVGKAMVDVIGGDAYASFKDRIDAVLSGQGQHFQQHGVAGKENVYFSIDFIPDIEGDGSTGGFFVMVTDITALKLAEQKLAALALFDSLTGLPNRHQFNERLSHSLHDLAGEGSPTTLMFLDIDRFKSINDSLGHAAGDEVLQEFARRLKDAVRPTDCVARLAGDEFVVLLDGLAEKADVGVIAEKILVAIAVDFQVASRPLTVSTSIGIARAASSDVAPSELLAAADAALYEAKARGRATFVIA